ncbi:hypothetical protein LGH70_15705 [Hymenobacter sp. BT635]|uniref:Copper chaperone n=1 Tax=Hymenobacter nitidus TaxID=2880929 RepID=A0ABS8AF67_9BACT|nr:hypothetical protein [Hymenobacter nitidus]MCB2379046.1 hypothetical protein [Hymenobacter nitidus]
MTTSSAGPAANNSQLVHYRLQLPTMVEPEHLITIRGILQAQQLVVDRIEPGEAHVASATGSDPDWASIKGALRAAGHPVEHTTTVEA